MSTSSCWRGTSCDSSGKTGSPSDRADGPAVLGRKALAVYEIGLHPGVGIGGGPAPGLDPARHEIADGGSLAGVGEGLGAGVEIGQAPRQPVMLAVRQGTRPLGVGEVAREVGLIQHRHIDLPCADRVRKVGNAQGHEHDILARQPGRLEGMQHEGLTAGALGIGDALALELL